MLRAALPLATALLFVAACGADTSGEEIDITGSTALTWGGGSYGVVLAHGASYDAASWEEQATAMAEQGTTVIAVEDISPDAIAAAVRQLRDNGIEDVALVGGSAGADAILRLATTEPNLPDQLILLSPNTVVDGLGGQPKLFIASEDEPVAEVSNQLAESAPGEDNDVVLLPGSAHAQGIFASNQGDRAMTLILSRLAQHSAPQSGALASSDSVMIAWTIRASRSSPSSGAWAANRAAISRSRAGSRDRSGLWACATRVSAARRASSSPRWSSTSSMSRLKKVSGSGPGHAIRTSGARSALPDPSVRSSSTRP
jgi:pimeloyl-ACP methyl ester carboxylesterase